MIVHSGENKRANRLVELLANWQKTNCDLSEMLGVSESTIRGMRAELQERHVLPTYPDKREFNGFSS